MAKFDHDRVVYHSKEDMSCGHFLSKAEVILKRNCNEVPNDINDVLELYNIKLYIDNELYLKKWSTSDIECFRETVLGYKQSIIKFISEIDDSNILAYHKDLIYGYVNSFWLLIDSYNVFKRISSEKIKMILFEEPHQIKIILRHKRVVDRYNEVLRIFLLSYHKSAEIILSVYEIENPFNDNEIFLPKSLSQEEKESIVSDYIDLETCNTNYLPIIQNSKKSQGFLISDKTRLKAKRKHKDDYVKFFGGESKGSFMKYGVSISYPENVPEIKRSKLEGSVVHYAYSLDFIKNDTHPHSLYFNFKLLFEYLDHQNRINIISKPSQIGIMESTMGVRSRNEYFCGFSFQMSQMTSKLQIFTYSEIINTLDSSLEEIIQFVYMSYFSEKYGFANNASLIVPTESASALEKVRSIAPELESVLKQYKLFVEDEKIDFELLQMSSSPSSIKDIPSLNKNKYCYFSKTNQEALSCSNLFFSDQTLLTYIEPFKEKPYETFFELLKNEKDIYFSNYEEHQIASLNYLIEKGYIFIDDGRVKISNEIRLSILQDLQKNEVASFYHYSTEFKEEAMAMCEDGMVYFESSLFSKPEQNYFNFYLNKSEFTNGLDLRNSYLHGTQAGSAEVSYHENSYLVYLKLLTLAILKIEDDLFINQSLK